MASVQLDRTKGGGSEGLESECFPGDHGSPSARPGATVSARLSSHVEALGVPYRDPERGRVRRDGRALETNRLATIHGRSIPYDLDTRIVSWFPEQIGAWLSLLDAATTIVRRLPVQLGVQQ